MPRNMSFSMTTEQICNRTKTVTRRTGWKFLQRHEVLNACVKCQGLKKGEKVERICQIRVVDVRQEPLDSLFVPQYGAYEMVAEGFRGMSPYDFVHLFQQLNKLDGPSQIITRIEFAYV